MYRIHHLEQSRSHRIVWLAEELGLDYELITYQRDPQTLCAPISLRTIHPLGKAPILEHNDRIINESAAIIDYLLDRKTNSLRPTFCTPRYSDYRYWMYFSEGSVMPITYARLVLACTLTSTKAPRLLRMMGNKFIEGVDNGYFDPEIERLVEYLTEHLMRHAYFVGESFTAADIQMAFPILALCRDYGNAVLEEWLKRVQERPAQRRAAQKGAGVELPYVRSISLSKAQ